MSIEFYENNKLKDSQLVQLKNKIEKENTIWINFLKSFNDLENEVDLRKIEEQSENNGRRKKSHSLRNFEFQGVSYRTIAEDLGNIYEDGREEEGFGSENFKRNDIVSCIVDRKKYKGAIISINERGMIIKTQDRRKIRLSWEDVEEGEAKVTKLQNDEE